MSAVVTSSVQVRITVARRRTSRAVITDVHTSTRQRKTSSQGIASTPRCLTQILVTGNVQGVCNIINVPIASFTHVTRNVNVQFINVHRRRSTIGTTTTSKFVANQPTIALAMSTPKFLGNLPTLLRTAIGNCPIVVVNNSSAHRIISLRRNRCRNLSRVGCTGRFYGTSLHVSHVRSVPLTITHTVRVTSSKHPNTICVSFPSSAITRALDRDRTSHLV